MQLGTTMTLYSSGLDGDDDGGKVQAAAEAEPCGRLPQWPLVVKFKLCGSETAVWRRPEGSRVKPCLELGRNEKVLITTLMPACQSPPAGLSRP